jgi:hypothetical protein
MNNSLWEILVPTCSNEGKPYRVRYHKVWDKEIKKISGGLTVMPVAKGKWINPKGIIFEERMIPVRIIATREQMDKIVDHTMKYYNQEAVLAYKISDEYILKVKEVK